MKEVVMHSIEELTEYLRRVTEMTNVKIRVEYGKAGEEDGNAGEEPGSTGTAES